MLTPEHPLQAYNGMVEEACRIRRALDRRIDDRDVVLRKLDVGDNLLPGVDLVTLTHGSGCDQVLVWLHCFLRTLGVPRSIRIVSDGTLTDRTKQWLMELNSRLPRHTLIVEEARDIRTKDETIARLIQSSRSAEQRALLRKLEILIGLGPGSIFADTDVIASAGAGETIASMVNDTSFSCHFNAQDLAAYDRRLIGDSEIRTLADNVNSGFVVLSGSVNWEAALARLSGLSSPNYFTEQTTLAVAALYNSAKPIARDVCCVIGGRDLPCRLDQFGPLAACIQHWTSRARFGFWIKAAEQCPDLAPGISGARRLELIELARASSLNCPVEFVRPETSGPFLSTLNCAELQHAVRFGSVFHYKPEGALFVCDPNRSDKLWIRLDSTGMSAVSLRALIEAFPGMKDDILRITEHELDALKPTLSGRGMAEFIANLLTLVSDPMNR